MDIKKKLLIICIILSLSIGIVSASDANQTANDAVGASQEDNVAIDQGDNINDTVTVSNDGDNIDREVLSSKGVDDISYDVIMVEGKKISNEEVLGASSDEDILGDAYYDSSYNMNHRFDRLSSQISSNTNKNKDVILTQDYTSNSLDEGVVVYNPSITGMPTSGEYILMKIGTREGVTLDRTMHIMQGVTTKISNIYFQYGRRDTGSQGGQVMIEKDSHVTFVNCVFDSARQCNAGGSIYADSNVYVEFINCTFKENELYTHEHYATTYGGSAIYMKDAAGAKFINTNFEDNNAPRGTATIYFAGISSNVEFENCNFTNNKAELTTTNAGANAIARNGQGAVIYFETPISNMNITNCNFVDNSAARAAGAIYFQAGCTNISIVNSTFSGNKIKTQEGGALYFGTDCSNIEIINSTFENNEAATSGGAIYFSGSVDNLLVNGSTFSNNQAKNGDGGAIYLASGQKINVTNSTFTNNKASNIGGAIYWGSTETFETKDSSFEGNEAKNGATIYFANDLPEIIVRDTKFLGNKETAGQGGAALNIPLDSHADTLYIINCTFIGNNVNGNGAAVYVPNGVKNVHVYNCSFEDNTASGNGGALYLANENELIVLNVTFARNTANDGPNVYIANAMNSVLFNDTYFINNTARTGNGAGISLEKITNAEFNNCTFEGNNALRGNGGALYVPSTINKIILNDINTYKYNHAGGKGGALYWDTTIDLDIDSHTFIGNGAYDGGAIYYTNTLNNKNFNDVTFINNTASNDGGALYIQANSNYLTFTNSNFTGNNATAGEGGAIYFNGGCTNITVNNIIFDNNAAVSGGAIHFYATSGRYSGIKIINSNFTNNKATANDEWGGSAIGLNRAYGAEFNKCIFDSNVAKSNGAVMFDNYENILFTECNFTNNNASKSGGAIYYKGTLRVGNSTYIKCNFDNNNASVSGGAIYSNGNDITIIDNNFTNNYAYNYGGAFINFAASYDQTKNVLIVNSSFTDNYAWKGAGLDIYHTENARIINCTFDDNVAGSEGAGIWIDGFYGLITNSNFTNNKAPVGSAIAYIPENPVDIGETKANITNCIFEKNNASDKGTVWFESSSGKIENCNFTENVAKIAGGVYVNIANVQIINSNFTGNNATEDGGAIYINTPATGSKIVSCNFINNNARHGAAVVLAGDNIQITQSNFTNNMASGNGGAVYVVASKSSLNISDSIFKENNAANGGAIYYGDSNINSNSLTIYNDTFISNKAIYNGGAIDYLVDASNYWRDYNNFNNESKLLDQTSKRYTWNHNGQEIIHTSYFENNIDYAMKASVSISVPTATITVTVPGRFDKTTTKINITVINETGEVYSYQVIEGSSIPSTDWKIVGDNIQITIRLDNQAESKYNTTVGIYDTNHNYKEEKLSYTISTVSEGRFEALQRLINEIIAGTTDGSIPVLELSEDYIYMPGVDHGSIHIDAPITIKGIGINPSRIDSLNYCRIFEVNSDNVTFDNILFANGNASGADGSSDSVHGGAIIWNGLNGLINNSIFEKNTAEYGGAVYWNASEGTINNTLFELNNANNGGAVMIDNVGNVKVLNSTFDNNNHAAIYVVSANNVLVNDTKFISNNDGALKIAGSENVNVTYSSFNSNAGRDIFIESNENVLLYNLTVNNSKQSDASIYVSSDVVMDNIKISNYESSNAIIFNSGKSTLMNSTISGNNPIVINIDANVNLTQNNNTNNNGAYSVENRGILYLNKNNFNNVIINRGTITSKTTTKVLNNATVTIVINEDAELNVSVVDDNDNVISVPVKFKSNDEIIGDATYNDKYYYFTYVKPNAGVYTISVNDAEFGLMMNDVQNATLKVNDPNTSIKLNITQEKQGEIVIIKATVSPNGVSGNVTFIVNDLAQVYKLNKTENLNGELVATLVLNNLTPNTYTVSATYNGDDGHYKCTSNSEIFVVNKRDVNISIEVKNIAQGENATAIVITNANGTVILSLNGRQEVIIENGKAIWNYSDLAPGVYTIYVDYGGNTYYNSASNNTTFEVYKFDMEVSVSETHFNQSAIITVTLPSDVSVMPKIYLDGNLLDVVNKTNGVFEAVTGNLAVGVYEVNVTFAGDSKYYAHDINGTKLNVTKDDSYPFDVTVSPEDIKFGDNVTIEVTGPVGVNVTVNIDGVNYTVKVNESGKGKLVLDNLTAGPHKIIANVTGNDNITSKEIVKEFSIDQVVPDIKVIVPEDIAPCSDANVTVVVGKNATGKVIVTIDGVPTVVNVTNGNVTLPIPTNKPGNHNITVEYIGDKNYAAPDKVTKVNYTVDKYDAEIIINDPVVNDNNSVVVVIEMNPSDATGNVTVTLANGTNVTVPLKDGKAEVNVGVLPINSTTAYNVTYSGSDKYNKLTKVADTNLTVGKLNNFTVDIDIKEGKYGENTTVKVNVTPGVGGNISVVVDNVSYPVTQDTEGNYIAIVPPLGLGSHNVTVKFENSSNYADKVINKTFNVVKNDDYEVNVNITEGKYGENTTIEITAPKDIGVINVTIDGVNYTVTINETTGKGVFNISNLTAGKHEVVTSFPGNEYYGPISTTKVIDIPKAESEMNITVDNQGPGKNVTVTVNVGPNATGLVVVEVNGEKHYVEVDENGNATYIIENAEPGDYNITTTFTGDDNYAKVNNTYKFTVDKFEPKIKINNTIVNDDNSVIVVVEMDPSDATGNVTVTLADGTNVTVPLTNGRAEVNVGVLPVNSTTAYNVTYSGDKKYNKATIVSEDNLTVERLNNFTVDISIVPGQYGENTTVKVNVTPGVGGNISVVVDNVSYPVEEVNGEYVAIIQPLSVGDHNVTVKFENSSNYADKVINKTYAVDKNDHYDVNITIVPNPTQFGVNTTIEVEIPEGMDNVTVIIDGKEIVVPVNSTSGKGSYVIDNLTSGNHTITVVTPGNDNYESVSNTTTLTVGQTTSDMNITFIGGEPGENLTVVVNVGPNATGHVVVTVNGQEHLVPVNKDGTATYVIPDAQPGDYNITAEFLGDDNYEPVKNSVNKTVPKYDSTIEILEPEISSDNNVTVVVKVNPANATGTVTVTVDGKNYTADVENGIARVNIGTVEPNTTPVMNINYSGDKNYAGSNITSNNDITVGKLNNLTVNITVIPGQYGENTTVKVNVPEDAEGNVSVVVDNVYYPVEKVNGEYVAIIPPSSVGSHNVTVKFENSTKYADKEYNQKFSVDKNDHYDLIVNVTEGKYGENTTIEITAPKDIGVINVTIDGVNYTVTINETTGKGVFNISNLTAGKHEIVTNFPGNDNYEPTSTTNIIDIPKAESEMNITVDNQGPGKNVTVTVNVGPNATGLVVVEVNGEKHYVEVDGNGNATYIIENAQPGDYNITTTFTGDDNYAKVNNTYKFTVDKFEPIIKINNTIVNDDNSVIVVVEMDPSDATGNVTVTLADGTNVTVPLTNGRAEVNVGVLPVNSTTAYNVTYSGDKKYNKAIIVSDDNLTVERLNNFTVDVEIIEGQYGENTTIKVNVTPGVGGNVSVVVDNVSYPVTQDDEGNYIAIIPPLSVGNHNVTVKFENSSNYADKVINKTYTVDKNDHYDVNITIVPNPTQFGVNTTIEVEIPEGMDNVTIIIDGKEIVVPVNSTSGKGSYVIDNLTSGNHTITVVTPGNDNYESVSNTTTLTVESATSDMNITFIGGEPGENLTVVVNVGPNATGHVVVTVNGQEHLVPVNKDGTATYVIPDAQPGDYNITAEFLGDDNYEPVKNSVNKTVPKYDSTIEVLEPEISSDNNVTVVVKVNPANATGTVTVTVDGKNYTADVENGIARVNIGTVEPNTTPVMNITYSGDKNYNPNELTSVDSVKVGPLNNFTADIEVLPGQYGENTTVKVIVPEDATGNITVTVDGKEYPVVKDENGTYVAQIPSDVVGNHTVKVSYTNDSRYNDTELIKTYDVDANDHYPLDVVVTPAPFGEDTVIDVTSLVGSNVTVNVDGVNYTVTVNESGKGQLTLNNLTAGKHQVTIEYGDGENYAPKKESKVFDIAKTTPAIDVNVTESNAAGTDIVVNVTMDKNATGWVNVIVDGKTNLVEVKDGKAELTVENAQPGNHSIVVKYLGDDNYENFTSQEYKFNVDTYETSMELLPIEVDENNNVTVVVKVNGTASGNVTVKVGNTTYNATVGDDGIARVNVGVLPAGDNDIVVTYGGDENFNATSISETIEVPTLKNYLLDIKSNNIDYGEVAQVNVTLPEGANASNVKLYVDGVENTNYTVVDNVVQLNVAGLGAGNHTIKVTYGDDGKYADNENTTVVSVSSVEPKIKDVQVTPADVGQPVNVTVKLPADAKGSIVVDVNGTKYEAPIVNGEANVSIPNLGNGSHILNITYTGDGNYEPFSEIREVEVSKVDPIITANTSGIELGENLEINVTVPEDATGTVTIKIGDIEKTVAVAGGLNNIIIPDVPVGDYEVEVTYNGNDKYAKNTTTTSLKVSPKTTTEDDVKIIDNGDGTITVIVPDNGTGNITVTIGNQTLPVENIVDGKATINLTNSDARPGSNNITVTYSGDGNHTPITIKSSAVIPKWDSSVSASAKTIREGDDAIIVVKVDPDMTGRVRVDLNGTGYYADIENGEAIIIAPGIKAGNYIGNVTYDGDSSYNPSNNTFTLEVEAPIVVNLDGAGNSSQLVIDLPENGTDNVVVLVDGKPVNVTVENGTAIADLSNMAEGEHNVTVIYTDKYGTQSVVNTTVKVYKSINVADKIVRGWNSPFDAEAEFLDKEGHVLVNTTVEFVINGKTYKVTTDEKGIGKLTTSHLAIGNYKVTIINPVTKEQVVRDISIVKRLIENKDITMDFVDGTQYVVRAIGDDGKPVSSGEVVGITVNGRGYVAITDGNGYARLTINLNPKKYTITSEYSNYKVSNKLVVKQTLKLVKKTVKVKKGKKLVLKAKLKLSNGKAIKGKVIKFKFKGKTYKAKTNKKGIAKVTIKKKVTKKLKKGKKFTYIASYMTNKVKGNVKIKK